MSPVEEAAAFWGIAENVAYSPEARLTAALRALAFYGSYYERVEGE